MPNNYRERLRELSDALIALQKPIRILDAIKWPQDAREEFFARKARELPAINRAYYQQQTPGFDTKKLKTELKALSQKVRRDLGQGDVLGGILQDTIDQYRQVIFLLESRGQAAFQSNSNALWGSASDHLRGDNQTLRTLGERLCETFSLPGARSLSRPYAKTIPADAAVSQLSERLGHYFIDDDIRVILADGIVSDASAGGDTIKINSNALFSELDLQVLEVHEGWVHIGTTLNGRNQPWASWLSVGAPRVTATQEGLAVLIETLTFSSFPDRARRISDRIIAIDMAEQGADFLDVYRYFLDKGVSEHDSFTITQRVFRGGMVEGGACFTKDLSYVRGFSELVNFIRSAAVEGVPEILPMLFAGKVNLDDIPRLYEYYLDGLIAAPRYLPPMFKNLNGLYVWFGFASGISHMDAIGVQTHYRKLFESLPHWAGNESITPDTELD